jgi:hypothetical protein
MSSGSLLLLSSRQPSPHVQLMFSYESGQRSHWFDRLRFPTMEDGALDRSDFIG